MEPFDVLRTIHAPVTAAGCTLKDAYGMRLARCTDPVLAHAMAELINVGARRLAPAPRSRLRTERTAVAA